MVAFAARRPDLRLVLPGVEDDDAFSTGLQKRIQTKVANDAQFLPKSTNMGLPNHVSTGVKYNFEEDSDVEDERPKSQVMSASPRATFKRSIPCFFVSHLPATLPWYQDVLGFQLRGKAESGRAELFRGPPGVNRGSEGVSLYLRKVPGETESPAPKGSLWIEVDDIDALHKEISQKVDKFAQDVNDYFPPRHLGSAKVVAKPRNTAFGQREMTTVDDGGNSIIFYQPLE